MYSRSKGFPSMNTRFEFCILVMCAFGAVATNASILNQGNVTADTLATTCGETLHVTTSASIEHQFGGSYEENEICPWIVRVDGASHIHFALDWPEYADAEAKVTVAAIDVATEWPYVTDLTSQDLGYKSGIFEVTLKGSVGVIVFRSKSAQGSGFALDITKERSSEHTLSPNSVDQIHHGSGRFEHAPDGGFYSNNELSTFVVAPRNFKSTCTGTDCTVIGYTEKTIEARCNDRVDTFRYIYLLKGGWRHNRVFCADEGPASLPNLGEMALITFATSPSVAVDGFIIQYRTVLDNQMS